ncbi:MAG: hypothetical protein QM765_47450 [Myxococcales bacterium]
MDRAEVHEQAGHEDAEEDLVDGVPDGALGDVGQDRLGRLGGRGDELEEQRHFAQGDLALGLFAERDRIGVTILLGQSLRLERREVELGLPAGEPARHLVGEAQDVAIALHLEDRERRRQVRDRDDDGVLGGLADRHRVALLDEALLDDLAALDDANP